MYKPNTVIVIAYDFVQINKIYMIDVTSKNFYYHNEVLFKFSADTILGYLPGIVLLIMTIFIGMPHQPNELFYLDDLPRNLKILITIIGILVGILMFYVLKIKNQGLHIKKYLQQYPDSVKVTKKDEIDKIMNKAQTRSTLIMGVTIGLLIWSIFIYRQFWNQHNFGSYLWATALFMVASATASLWKNARFIMKLHTEMYANDV